MILTKYIEKYLFQSVSIAPLVTFRILFGALMAYGAIRFWMNGSIEKLYLEPTFFLKFYGFEWVQVPGDPLIYFLFGLVIASAFGVMLGCFYRLSAILFFCSFTYSQLLDATNYLNHYYLVCLLAFLMIFLPAHRNHSIDSWRIPSLKIQNIPAWCINVVIFQICCVYFFAGLAKIDSDWLLNAMPMAIWLPERTDTPLLGYLFQFKETAYLFSWFGAIYDLSIWAFLLNSTARPFAYLAVVVFHVLTKILFNIGMFPVIMIFSTLIFFSGKWHERLHEFLGFNKAEERAIEKENNIFIPVLLGIFMLFQIAFPLRHNFYNGNVLWNEEGYRFSWRVMLVEKSGLATFTIKDGASSKKQEIVNGSHLTKYQEKQMAIQPDFILQYAKFLKKEYEEKHGFKNPIITVDAHVAMNGRRSKRFIDSDINLSEMEDSFLQKKWVINYE